MIWRLISFAIRLNLHRLWYFKTSLVLDTVSSLAYAAITVLFWEIIYGRVRPLPGWTLGQTFTFTAFVELFYALTMALFPAAGKFWGVIITGRIDVYLVRPTDPRLLMSLLNLRLENLVRAIPSITLLTALALRNGFQVSLVSLPAALTVVLMGVLSYTFLQMAGSWISFWLGRTEVLDEITDSFQEFVRYPYTIFPDSVKLLLTTLAPMALAASQPAQILAKTEVGVWTVLLTAAGVAGSWWAAQEFLWQRGRRRYDSYGG